MRVIKAKQDKIVKGIRSILDVYNGSGNDDDRMNRIMNIVREPEVEDAFEEQEKEYEEMKRIRDNQVALLPLTTTGKS